VWGGGGVGGWEGKAPSGWVGCGLGF
jgi:hypothetical protein